MDDRINRTTRCSVASALQHLPIPKRAVHRKHMEAPSHYHFLSKKQKRTGPSKLTARQHVASSLFLFVCFFFPPYIEVFGVSANLRTLINLLLV